MNVSVWLNTAAAVQMSFIECIFVFFVTLFLKMTIILGTSKPQCFSRLSKPVLKILSISRKSILGKQLSLAIYSKYIFRLLHAPKFHIFSTKLNKIVKVVKLFAGLLWKRCSDNFIGKHLCRSLFFNNVSRLQTKEKLMHRCFYVSFTKYFRTLFLQNSSVWLLLLNTLFCLLRQLQPEKMLLSTLFILHIFETNTALLANSSLWRSYPDSCD